MSLIRHLAIHEVSETNNKSGEDDEEETIDAATTNNYDDVEEHKLEDCENILHSCWIAARCSCCSDNQQGQTPDIRPARGSHILSS